MPICLACIGTNYCQEENLPLAQRKLRELFPRIRFSSELETAPLYVTNPARFINQVALFDTTLSMDAIRGVFKEIEVQSGRLPEDKRIEKVCLDIDLLFYGDEVLKPADLVRDYVLTGIGELLRNF